MQSPDVNVLVYAHRHDSPHHATSRAWLEGALAGDDALAVTEFALSGFVRIATNRRIFREPTPLDVAFEFCEQFLNRDDVRILRPTTRTWRLFQAACTFARISGGDVSDAYLAAQAMEHNVEFVTADRGFHRFPGLRVVLLSANP